MTSASDDQDIWEQARLIPVSGIRGADEQERRGVSALLATLGAVREFGHALVCPLGAPRGRVATFIEVPFSLGERQLRPDGIIRVTRGKACWTALVEAKTGHNELRANQLEDYLDLARQRGYDAVLTISNQLATAPGQHPTAVDAKKLRKVALRHLSWSQIHTEAIRERLNREVSDPDQAWILTELIRYLEHPQSGAIDFDDMGPSWVQVRDAVVRRMRRPGDQEAVTIVARFNQLASFAGMRLSRRLGVDVEPSLTKAELQNISGYLQHRAGQLVESGVMSASLKVPDAIGPIEVLADLRAGRISCRITLNAPAKGKNTTRVNWLVRQLNTAPADIMIEATALWAKAPGPTRELSVVRENPASLFEPSAKELRAFTISRSRPAGTKRGKGRGSFVASVLDLVDEFYEDVVQHLKQWTAPAPTVKERHDAPSADEDGVTGALPGGPDYHELSGRPSDGGTCATSSPTDPPIDGFAAATAEGPQEESPPSDAACFPAGEPDIGGQSSGSEQADDESRAGDEQFQPAAGI